MFTLQRFQQLKSVLSAQRNSKKKNLNASKSFAQSARQLADAGFNVFITRSNHKYTFSDFGCKLRI